MFISQWGWYWHCDLKSISYTCLHSSDVETSLVAQVVKNLPAMQKTQVPSLGWEDSLKKGMITHSSILAWRIPLTEEPGGLQSMRSQRVGHTNTHTHTHTHTFIWILKNISVIRNGNIPGWIANFHFLGLSLDRCCQNIHLTPLSSVSRSDKSFFLKWSPFSLGILSYSYRLTETVTSPDIFFYILFIL